MLPIVTPDEMRAIDFAAAVSAQVLIDRAGSAVARSALRMMGGSYGRTVVVLAGPGNNGADGRVAAQRMEARGVRVKLFTPESVPASISDVDLVIDAAYGTGLRASWNPPDVGDIPVLAVDIPSGVDALTGAVAGSALMATRTVTFAALKPGQLVPPGSDFVGELELVDIGLAVNSARANLTQQSDVAEWWPRRATEAHKWQSAARIIAGSPSMTGAASLAAQAALRTGAGMVQLSAPGVLVTPVPAEIVQRPLARLGWADEALGSLDRFRAGLIGCGMGREDSTCADVRRFIVEAPVPLVIDGDGLFALGWNAEGAASLLRKRNLPTVLTPHDGEFALLTGAYPGADRLVAARRLAADTGAIVLLKGPATVVAAPDGEVLVVTTGDARLATAGTGDVLAGMIVALLASGVDPFWASAAAAWVHGQAAALAAMSGMIASDIAEHIPRVLDAVLGGGSVVSFAESATPSPSGRPRR
jgi:ADP-dependent NAD(P)H-hydrate dehydratase / NAD(P)H-hydrate epimerase